MDIKLRVNRIKTLRAEKMWSQEELARASGLGLRTIQRVEKEGKGSNETLKALASVFEVEAARLAIQDHEEVSSVHRQPGYTVMIISVLAAGIVWGVISGQGVVNSWYGLFAVLPVVVLGVLFCTLNVSVTRDGIAWSFGSGVLKKRLDYSGIQACRVFSVSWFTGGGFGIRRLGSGWLYRVCGTQAVEIELKAGSVVLLGSDEPKFLQASIERYLDWCSIDR